jgi:hypothetical protein
MPDVKPVASNLSCVEVSISSSIVIFTQIKFRVECDESYHQGQLEQDRHRQANTEETFGAIKQNDSYSCYKVNLSVETPEDAERQINEYVKTVRRMGAQRKRESNFASWIVDERGYIDYCAKMNEIRADENIRFPTIADACNTLFATQFTMIRRDCFRPSTFEAAGYGNYVVGFPKLFVEGTPQKGDWDNVISMGHKYICERPTEVLKSSPNYHPEPDGTVDPDGVGSSLSFI